MGKTGDGKKKTKPKARSTKFTPEVGDKICMGLIAGKSLRKICEPKDMPFREYVYNWLLVAVGPNKTPELEAFYNQYVRARDAGIDVLFDEIQDIADDATNDYVPVTGRDGKIIKKLDKEHIQRSKLRIDTRISMAERLKPKKYKMQSAVDHTIADTPRIVIAPRGSKLPPDEG